MFAFTYELIILFCQHVAYYSFHRPSLNTATYVSTVYAVCGDDDLCVLNSTETNTELAVAAKWNHLLDSDDNCVVNFVEIIHDCMPRRVDLSLSFTSHATHSLYLMVRITLYLFTYSITIAINIVVMRNH